MSNFSTREPLAIRGALVAATTAVLHACVVLGVVPLTPEGETSIAVAIDLVGMAILVVWTRGKVTPVAAPVLPESSLSKVSVEVRE